MQLNGSCLPKGKRSSTKRSTGHFVLRFVKIGLDLDETSPPPPPNWTQNDLSLV